MTQNAQTPLDKTSEAEFRAGFVALFGRSNVGKSTIMNAIMGVKIAIATAKPQTTRNRILGVRTYPEKGQLCFVDTPGFHDVDKTLNRQMVSTALESLQDVDEVAYVVDAASLLDEVGGLPLEQLPDEESRALDKLREADKPLVVVLNKVDLVSPKPNLLPLIEFFSELDGVVDVVPTSATEGDNLDRLKDVLLEHLPESPSLFPEDMLTNRAERFIAAEYVREHIMRQTRQEVPYAVAVEIDRFAETPDGDGLEIYAVIHVEKESQKGIIIGKGGKRIKEIGTAARHELEQFFQRHVYLETHVRVEQEWSEDPDALERFGYG